MVLRGFRGALGSSFVWSNLIDTPVATSYTTVAFDTPWYRVPGTVPGTAAVVGSPYLKSSEHRRLRGFSMLLKQIRGMTLVLSFGLGLYAAGCGSINMGRGATGETPQSSPDATETDDGVPLSDRGPAGDMNEPVSASARPPSGSTAPDADTRTSTSVPTTPLSGGGITNYRVQIYSFSDRDAAETAMMRVKRYLADWLHGVYLDEEGGDFKIRVGDFADKADADLLRDRLRREGYPDAWTTTTRGEVP